LTRSISFHIIPISPGQGALIGTLPLCQFVPCDGATADSFRIWIPDGFDADSMMIKLAFAWSTYKKLWKMGIEIVDFPIENDQNGIFCMGIASGKRLHNYGK